MGIDGTSYTINGLVVRDDLESITRWLASLKQQAVFLRNQAPDSPVFSRMPGDIHNAQASIEALIRRMKEAM